MFDTNRELWQILEEELEGVARYGGPNGYEEVQDYIPPVQPQQPQETVDSTNWEGASSDSPPLNHENAQDNDAQNQQAQNEPRGRPIPSIMDLWEEPEYGIQSSLQKHEWAYVIEKGSPPQIPVRELRDPSNDTAEEENQGPRIPSAMDEGPNSSDEPWEPHIDPMYAVLVTTLERTEAKRLREEIRNDGFNAFSCHPWKLT